MKKSLILLLISLCLPTLSFSEIMYPILTSDSLVIITPKQLKETNIIFLNHQYLQRELHEYKYQVEFYRKANNNLILNDSIKSLKFKELNDKANNIIQEQYLQINKQAKINRVYKTISICGVTVSITLLVLLLCQ